MLSSCKNSRCKCHRVRWKDETTHDELVEEDGHQSVCRILGIDIVLIIWSCERMTFSFTVRKRCGKGTKLDFLCP